MKILNIIWLFVNVVFVPVIWTIAMHFADTRDYQRVAFVLYLYSFMSLTNSVALFNAMWEKPNGV
jgi:hypothetical protein